MSKCNDCRCLTQFARYICPRCNIAYCSLACYKAHNEHCTEAFSRYGAADLVVKQAFCCDQRLLLYAAPSGCCREQAVSQLQEIHAEPAERRKVLNLLQRVAAQQAADDAVLQAGGIPSASANYSVTDDLEGIDAEDPGPSSDSGDEDGEGDEGNLHEQPQSSMPTLSKGGRHSTGATPGLSPSQRQDAATGLKLSRTTIDRLVAKV
jgi:hypothetical protein